MSVVRTQQQTEGARTSMMLVPVRDGTDHLERQGSELSSAPEGLSSDEDEESPPPLLDCDDAGDGDWERLGEEGCGWHLGGLLEALDKPPLDKHGLDRRVVA